RGLASMGKALPAGFAPNARPKALKLAAWSNGSGAMYDLSVPNVAPGTCEKCRGTGVYRWGAVVNGKCEKEGICFSCRGTGKQKRADIRRNTTYNKHKIARLFFP